MYGQEVDPADFDLTPFDADAINRQLAPIGAPDAGPTAPLPEPLADLLERIFQPSLRRRLLHLAAQELGLLRKARGHLHTTARARELEQDAVGPWRHLAERMPRGSRNEAVRQAGLDVMGVAQPAARHG